MLQASGFFFVFGVVFSTTAAHDVNTARRWIHRITGNPKEKTETNFINTLSVDRSADRRISIEMYVEAFS